MEKVMSTTLDQLSHGVKEILGLDEVNVDVPMSQIGIDSLNVVEMIIVCQQVYSNVVNYEDINIDETTTLREIDEQMQALSQI
jgi:acyl carrier protein